MSVTVSNPTSNLSGATIVLIAGTHTITGSWTFSRSPSAPFTVTAGSAKVANLDADKLDGLDSTSFVTLPVAADLTFTDATYDIGKTGATRPRDLFLSRNATVGGTLGVTGATTLSGGVAVTGAATVSTTLGVTGLVTAPGVPQLLKAGSGTDTTATATNVDTIAITGLTALDTLVIEYGIRSVTQATANPSVRNNTDGVALANITSSAAALAATDRIIGTVKMRQLQHSNVSVFSQTVTSVAATGAISGDVLNPALTTPWTSPWTLALRHNGVTAGGTFQWSWAVYRIPGQ